MMKNMIKKKKIKRNRKEKKDRKRLEGLKDERWEK